MGPAAPYLQVILSTNIAESSVTVPDVRYGTDPAPARATLVMSLVFVSYG